MAISNSNNATQLTGPRVRHTPNRQIGKNLEQRRRILEEKEAELQIRALNWESQAATQQRELDARQTELDRREEALHQLQFQMLELQNQIIESQLAIEGVVEKLVTPVTPAEPLEGMIALRNELGPRFDQVEERWTCLYQNIHQIAEEIATAMNPKQIILD